ncbi:hypothetical protein J7432_05925 [Xanthomonas axonopodis pv. begoniae]|nr:hypothetical protein [Xanthomonas axonopodis pv. begoniae]MBO9773325.1 hypothetical protein [Xanthomonas axonopodis pv. begoniae]PPT26732.1 hypothetical protein XabCFBP2524_22395 [Xanthomonas axonopodis pv. begoniae]
MTESLDAKSELGGALEVWSGATHNGTDYRAPSKFGWWRPREIEGVMYGFDHLWPFDFQVSRPANGKFSALDVLVTVNFDCHVVSEQFESCIHGAGSPDDSRIWFDTGGHKRCFELDRYERSLVLPEMVRGLGNSKTACYRAKKDNYMIWRPEGAAGKLQPCYQAFFTLTAPISTPHKVLLYIQSAYVKQLPRGVQWENRQNFIGQCAKLVVT